MLSIESKFKRNLAVGALTALGFLAAGCGSKANSNPAPAPSNTTVSGGESGTAAQTSQPETPTATSASPTNTSEIPLSIIDVNLCETTSVNSKVIQTTFSTADSCQYDNSNDKFGYNQTEWVISPDTDASSTSEIIVIRNTVPSIPAEYRDNSNNEDYNSEPYTHSHTSVDNHECGYEANGALTCFLGPSDGTARVTVNSFLPRDQYTSKEATIQIMKAIIPVLEQKSDN